MSFLFYIIIKFIYFLIKFGMKSISDEISQIIKTRNTSKNLKKKSVKKY